MNQSHFASRLLLASGKDLLSLLMISLVKVSASARITDLLFLYEVARGVGQWEGLRLSSWQQQSAAKVASEK